MYPSLLGESKGLDLGYWKLVFQPEFIMKMTTTLTVSTLAPICFQLGTFVTCQDVIATASFPLIGRWLEKIIFYPILAALKCGQSEEASIWAYTLLTPIVFTIGNFVTCQGAKAFFFPLMGRDCWRK